MNSNSPHIVCAALLGTLLDIEAVLGHGSPCPLNLVSDVKGFAQARTLAETNGWIIAGNAVIVLTTAGRRVASRAETVRKLAEAARQ